MGENHTVKVLFVCLGNICRSPMAEAVFRKVVEDEGLADRFEIASSGTSGYHVGDRPHPGTRDVLNKHGIQVDPAKRAQKLPAHQVKHYDYVIAMDAENASDLYRLGIKAPRLLEFSPQDGPLDVPDPYYTNRFEDVYRMVEAGARGLLEHIRSEQSL